MRLIASLVVHNERARYLHLCLDHLRTFCDEIVVLDDGSDDGTDELLADYDAAVSVIHYRGPRLFGHEGQVRQRLLEATLARKPTHVLALDADEFVSDGLALRSLLADAEGQVWRLSIEEVWQAREEALWIREDGGWRSHPLPVIWRPPARLDATWRIRPRRLASGRLPAAARSAPAPRDLPLQLLHFGWADEPARAARYERYRIADGGRFHARAHLDSIMWTDERVVLRERAWPPGVVFSALRQQLVAQVAA